MRGESLKTGTVLDDVWRNGFYTLKGIDHDRFKKEVDKIKAEHLDREARTEQARDNFALPMQEQRKNVSP